MKKYIIFPFIIIMLAFANIACDDFLDENPDNRTTLDSGEKIRKLLVSAYSTRTYAYILECASDNMDQNDSKYSNNILVEAYYQWRNDVETGNDQPENLFRQYYNAIANSNQALDAISQLNETPEILAYKGEAYITRAFSHFVLANIYCKHYGTTSSTDLGMPYMEKPETEVSPEYTRGTVEQLYEKINADIETALPLIDDNIYRVPKYHFNKKAAYAFAARFNLYYGKYDKAIKYATEVLGENPASVLRDWETLSQMPGNGNLKTDTYIDVANPATLLVLSTYSLWGRIYHASIRYNHNKAISTNETLHASGPWGVFNVLKMKPITYSGGSQAVSINKMEEYFEITDPVSNTGFPHVMHVLFTTDETLLCRAEAYALQKEYQKAMDDMNIFMKAYSNYSGNFSLQQIVEYYKNIDYYRPLFPTVKKKLNPDFQIVDETQENLLHFILHVRRLLTLHEGLRWSDIKRYGIEIYRRSIDDNQNITLNETLTKEDPRRALQLPISVIGAGLEPNPRP